MSVRISGLYLDGGGQAGSTPKPPPVAIVTPHRSNSLDILNFEEKRQLIASSLSLTDFLQRGGSVTSPSSPTSGPIYGKKVNGAGLRTNSLGSATPPIERKSKFSAFGRLFKPWKWKRKKKSEKFEATSRSLERKISVRAPREELVQKGILLLDSPTSPLPGPLPPPVTGENSPLVCMQPIHPIQITPPQFQLPPISAPSPQSNDLKKERSDESKQGESETTKPERPSSLGPPNLTRRLLSYHNDLYNSPVLSSAHQHDGGGEDDRASPPEDSTDSPLTLSELPEPPIPVSEIGPIPPPPMFSSHPLHTQDYSYQDCQEGGEYSDGEGSDCETESLKLPAPNPTIDTSRVEEIPAKEPKFHAIPLKSALKKPPTPTQESPQPQYKSVQLVRPVRFGLSLGIENKENTRPGDDSEGSDSSGDGPVLYRDDDPESRLAAKIARKDSLALKLALRPDRQELIDRNILQIQTEKERQETKEAVGARLIRRLSMRPTQEELEERNILKKNTAAEEKKLKEEKKRMLLRKLSFRPTVEELKEKKIIRFNDYIEVTQAHDYDRRADKPWTRLTPKDKAAIRKELNEFKSSEMEVHQESRHLTSYKVKRNVTEHNVRSSNNLMVHREENNLKLQFIQTGSSLTSCVEDHLATAIEKKKYTSQPRALINDILRNISDLEESLKLSHKTERIIFQNELQMQIDNHCLDIELTKEKTKNQKLKKLNENGIHSFYFSHKNENNSEAKYFKNKCLELTALLKKRSHQLNKARAQIRDLKVDKGNLESKLKLRGSKLNELKSEYNEYIAMLKDEVEKTKNDAERQREMFISSDIQAALQQQIRRNEVLSYMNHKLKSQIVYSKRVNKFNVSTQISMDDIDVYSGNVSG